jgi:hypothetical protein
MSFVEEAIVTSFIGFKMYLPKPVTEINSSVAGKIFKSKL